MVFSGRMPFKRKMINTETANLIINSRLNWELINDETSPIIRRFVENKKRITIHGKKGNAHTSIWTSGAIIVTGVTSRKEAEKYYLETIKDLKKYTKVMTLQNKADTP